MANRERHSQAIEIFPSRENCHRCKKATFLAREEKHFLSCVWEIYRNTAHQPPCTLHKTRCSVVSDGINPAPFCIPYSENVWLASFDECICLQKTSTFELYRQPAALAGRAGWAKQFKPRPHTASAAWCPVSPSLTWSPSLPVQGVSPASQKWIFQWDIHHNSLSHWKIPAPDYFFLRCCESVALCLLSHIIHHLFFFVIFAHVQLFQKPLYFLSVLQSRFLL